MQSGDTLSWTRTFSEQDVHAFSQLSSDKGSHHVLPDEKGRLMVQGLLTASLPSKIGGDIDYIAREMLFRFHRPVYAGDTIRCEVSIDTVDDSAEVVTLTCSWNCTNQDGVVVMTGGSHGIVRNNRRT